MLVTFLLTGARLREIVHLDKADVDLHQSTIRLHRKGGEVNVLPLADSAKLELKAYLKQRRRRCRTRPLFISCRNRRILRGAVWYLVKIFEEIPHKDAWHGASRIAPYLCDVAIEPGREPKGHSESYEPQESCDNGSVSAFSKPRVGESGQRVKVVGRLECRVVQFNLRLKI